jgi:UDP-N-acetylglucosamine acyltransferase
MAIHPTAIIHKDAWIDESCEIGPYVIIEDSVKIGKNNQIMSHVFIGKGTTIGDENQIHTGAVIGNIPQDISFKNEKTYLNLGSRNIIREHVTLHRATGEGKTTSIGNNCFFMACSHVAHNCKIGDNVILANCVSLAGHTEVGNRVNIAGGTVIHQFVRIGRNAMVAGNARISIDVPPFLIAGERNQAFGINTIGLKRSGFSIACINELRELFKLYFYSLLPRPKAIESIRLRSFSSPEIEEFLSFVESTKRGICRFIPEKNFSLE